MSLLKYISDNLTIPELLCQLAEECSELSKASLKVRRTLVPDCSPTPITYEEAMDNFKEEIADIRLVLLVLNIELDDPDISAICDKKMLRWAKRLEDAKCSMTEK